MNCCRTFLSFLSILFQIKLENSINKDNLLNLTEEIQGHGVLGYMLAYDGGSARNDSLFYKVVTIDLSALYSNKKGVVGYLSAVVANVTYGNLSIPNYLF